MKTSRKKHQKHSEIISQGVNALCEEIIYIKAVKGMLGSLAKSMVCEVTISNIF